MCMKKNNNRLLRGVAAVLCLALMFLTMSGMAMATDMEDAPAGGAPESTPEIMEAEPSRHARRNAGAPSGRARAGHTGTGSRTA